MQQHTRLQLGSDDIITEITSAKLCARASISCMAKEPLLGLHDVDISTYVIYHLND